MKILSFGRFRLVFAVLSLTSVVASAQVGEILTAGRAGAEVWKLGGWSGILAFAVGCLCFIIWLLVKQLFHAYDQVLRVTDRAARNHSESNAAMNRLVDELRLRPCIAHSAHQKASETLLHHPYQTAPPDEQTGRQ
jgi:hypothetical protein